MVKKGKKAAQNDDVAIKSDDNDVEDNIEPEITGDADEQTEDVDVDIDPLTAAKAEAEKNLDGWQRTLAEFQNYKRRVEREQMALWSKASLDTVSDLLPIFDDFERALANIPEDLQNNTWVSGVALIQTKFSKLLEDYDVEVIDPTGEEFDPNCHQAIGTSESDAVESGHVIQTLQKGYQSGKTLIRPALVMVAS